MENKEDLSGFAPSDKDYRKEFVELIKNNPDLPIIPLSASRISDDNDYWVGELGFSYTDYYLVVDGYTYIRSGCSYDDIVDVIVTKEISELMDDGNKKAMFDSLPWQKAIFVYVEPKSK